MYRGHSDIVLALIVCERDDGIGAFHQGHRPVAR
jgi:hypothetical protein